METPKSLADNSDTQDTQKVTPDPVYTDLLDRAMEKPLDEKGAKLPPESVAPKKSNTEVSEAQKRL